ncbi:hypothetical protein [Jiangella alba]|uniref:Uncharacterized protein n=1 Tax=Jiangella alba TaxID=561176 RepID=A0A1H5PJC4_9ACTN|nr:hypothetical protein [Jiangella alba]SEF13806.1 hypothetical protein SAMN04488561_4480 [Jiangella alba]
MTTISDGTTTLTPLLVVGWNTTRETRTRVHVLIGRTDPDVTIRPAALRSGQLTLLVSDAPACDEMETLHASGVILTMADDDVDVADMAYVVSGPLTRELDPQTLTRWLLRFDFAEVIP